MATVPASLLVPALVVLGGVVVALLADAFGGRRFGVWTIAATLLGATVVGVALLLSEGPAVTTQFAAVGGFVVLGAIGYLLAAAAVVAGYARLSAAEHGVASAALIAIGALFAAALAAALDLVVFFVSLAGLGVVGYSLVAGAGSRRAEESAMRYFVQGTVASGLTVYALALLMGLGDGSSSYLMEAVGLPDGWARPALLAMALVTSALAFKVGAFPFHSWVPDAYENSSPPVAAYLASVPKLGGVIALVVLVRGTLFSGSAFESAGVILQVLAAGSLIFGALGMLRQRSLGRLLGYSAIAQVGYALMAAAVGTSSASATAVFIATYAVAACAAFVGVEAIVHAMPDWDGSLEGLAGLSRRSPMVAGAMVVVLLSLAGMPPMLGFWGKLLAFTAAVQDGLLWLALLAGVAAVVSFASYGTVIRWMYFHEAESVGQRPDGRPASATTVLVALAVLIVAAGVIGLGSGLDPIYRLLAL